MRYADARRRGGFTLVELMVALVISGILMTVVFQMLTGQTRVSAAQSGREEAQQNVRGALEIISSELRATIPGAILETTDESITFMQPRAWGILCAQPSLTTLIVAFPTSGNGDAWAASQANGILLRNGVNTGAWLPVPDLPNRAQIQASANAAAGNCQNPSGTVTVVQLTSSVALPVVPVGSSVVTYTLTQYDVGTDADGVQWLQRNNGIAGNVFDQQPLAGPLEANGFRLVYYTGNPLAETPPPATAAGRAALRMVGVEIATTSTETLNGRAQRDQGETTVLLRN